MSELTSRVRHNTFQVRVKRSSCIITSQWLVKTSRMRNKFLQIRRKTKQVNKKRNKRVWIHVKRQICLSSERISFQKNASFVAKSPQVIQLTGCLYHLKQCLVFALVLSSPHLAYPITLPSRLLTSPILCLLSSPLLFSPVLPSPVLSGLVVSSRVLSCRVSFLVLSCFVLPWFVFSCLASVQILTLTLTLQLFLSLSVCLKQAYMTRRSRVNPKTQNYPLCRATK